MAHKSYCETRRHVIDGEHWCNSSLTESLSQKEKELEMAEKRQKQELQTMKQELQTLKQDMMEKPNKEREEREEMFHYFQKKIEELMPMGANNSEETPTRDATMTEAMRIRRKK